MSAKTSGGIFFRKYYKFSWGLRSKTKSQGDSLRGGKDGDHADLLEGLDGGLLLPELEVPLPARLAEGGGMQGTGRGGGGVDATPHGRGVGVDVGNGPARSKNRGASDKPTPLDTLQCICLLRIKKRHTFLHWVAVKKEKADTPSGRITWGIL